MRITGFTGTVKKDVPLLRFPNWDGTAFVSGDNIVSYTTNDWDSRIKDIREYRYIIAIVESTEGKRGASVVPLVPEEIKIYREESCVRCDNIYFHVNGIGDFYLWWENWWENSGEFWGSVAVCFQETEEGVSFGDEEYFVEAQYDENGNYAGGSVFMLV